MTASFYIGIRIAWRLCSRDFHFKSLWDKVIIENGAHAIPECVSGWVAKSQEELEWLLFKL